jgi:hypothetical protein
MGTDVLIQENNPAPKYRFQAMASDQLSRDDRLGSGAYSAFWRNDLPNWSSIADQIAGLGVKRLDTSLPEIEEPIDWTWSETEIPQEYDYFIDALNEHGIAVNYLIHFWDKEGRARGEQLATPRFKTESQIQSYLDYVRLVVGHFKGRVQYYTIWSEPDNCGGEGVKCIEPKDYIKLVNQTVPAIRQMDPAAKVAIAPNVLYFAQDYLFTLLDSDIMNRVDVVQWHGIYNAYAGSEFYGDYYYRYPHIVEQIKQAAQARGFDGAFWGTEVSYCSREFSFCQGEDQPWAPLETDKLAAKYYGRMLTTQLGMDVGTGLPSFIEGTGTPWAIPTIRNLYTILDGTQPSDFAVEIQNEQPDTAVYSFTLPNGDTLVALWTDGIAQEDDEGTTTTVVLPAANAEAVVAIDPLHGFEQELVTVAQDDQLVIENLMVQDFPLFLKVAAASP